MEIAAQLVVNSLITGSIYALVASGFTLIYGSMRFFNMAYGANVMAGALIFYAFLKMAGLPIGISIALACVLTALLMLVVDRICYYGLRQRRVPEWSPVVVSMSVATILLAVATMIFGSSGRKVLDETPNRLHVFGATVTTVQAAMFVTALAIMVGFTVFLQKARTGKLIRALANDKQMAAVVGINPERVYLAIIIAGSFLATVAGVFYALDTNVRPFMGTVLMTKAIVIAIVGGVGNMKGTMLAAFAIGAIENLSTIAVGSGWRDAVPLLIIIVVMLVRPSAFGIEEAI